MNRTIGLSLLAAGLLILCIPLVSAFTIDSYTTDPSAPFTSNTPVTVSYTLGFPPASDATFPSGNDLVMATDLTNPQWTYTLILEGVENPRSPVNGTPFRLSGFELSYPSTVNESVRVTLTGTAPEVSSSTGKVIVDVHEVTSTGTPVITTQVTRTAVVNTALRPVPSTSPLIIQALPAMPSRQNNPLDQILGMFKAFFGR